MIKTNIPSLKYLEVDNCEDYVAKTSIIELEQQNLFNKDEFEYVINDFDYLQYDIVKDAFEVLVSLYNIGEAEFDFGNDQANDYFRSLDTTKELERFIFDAKTYGNSYLQVSIEDNPLVTEIEQKPCLYKIEPTAVYAHYSEYNLQKPADFYTVTYVKQEKDYQVILLIDFYPGKIVYSAIKITGEQTVYVDPLEYFEDAIDTTDLRKEDLSYVHETGLMYSSLQAIHYNKHHNSFYGVGDINLAVASHLNNINRMGNLATQLVVDNSQPPLQLNKEAEKALKNSIKEATMSGDGTDEANTFPVALNGPTNSNGAYYANAYNYQEYKVKKLAKKKFVTLTGDGRGDNKYITNPTDINQVLSWQDKLFNSLMSELKISQVLKNIDISTGQLTGEALKRLMMLTISHVESLRQLFTPAIQRVAYTLLEASQAAGLPDASFVLNGLPTVTYPPIIKASNNELIAEWANRVNNRFNTLQQAVIAVNGVDEETANEIISENEPDEPEVEQEEA